jgi:predicted anti-sigma-YlaC factor YlaD
LKPEIERKSFSVNFYNKEYKNLDSVVCEAHCRTCASHKAYSNKAAGYSFVEVEVI